MKILNSWRRNETLEETIAGSYSHVRMAYAASVPALLLVTLCDTEPYRDSGSGTNSINYYEIIGGRNSNG